MEHYVNRGGKEVLEMLNVLCGEKQLEEVDILHVFADKLADVKVGNRHFKVVAALHAIYEPFGLVAHFWGGLQ